MESNGRLEDSLKGPNGIQVALGEQFERANEVQVAPKLAPSAPKLAPSAPKLAPSASELAPSANLFGHLWRQDGPGCAQVRAKASQ